MGSLTQGLDHLQQQSLSPRLLRAVRLLQLSSLDFAHEVQDALDNNPFLESDEIDNDSPPDIALASAPERQFAAETIQDTEVPPGLTDLPATDTSEADGDPGATFDDEHENSQADGFSAPRQHDAGVASLLDLRASEESLNDALCRQLGLLPLSPRDRVLAEALVGSLDDDGYLRADLAELAGITDLDPPPSGEELHIALSRVQSLEPAGIGARTVQECLYLQLPAIEPPEQRELARRTIDDYFDALVANDISGLARALSHTPARIQAVLADIRRLDPHPGARFGAPPIQYVNPDVIVKKVRGAWMTTLNPAIIPKVRLNRVYAEMFQRTRCAQHAELATHLHDAQWTVSNVEQRFATILSVAQAIVSRQHRFLEYGPLAMKPLGLREIADSVGVHESTVSRVTNNKFMSTPLGVFELKYFFSRAMATAAGGECSATAIRGLIKEMISVEHPQAPLSDADIARHLSRQGLIVARRTVTKYRQALHIEAYERRRQHA